MLIDQVLVPSLNMLMLYKEWGLNLIIKNYILYSDNSNLMANGDFLSETYLLLWEEDEKNEHNCLIFIS